MRLSFLGAWQGFDDDVVFLVEKLVEPFFLVLFLLVFSLFSMGTGIGFVSFSFSCFMI